jgi:hypothetical protein
MDDSVWRLPGPDRMLSQVVREVQRGRHVAVVLPAFRAAEESFVDGLIAELMRGLSACGEDPRRATITDLGANPAQTLARCLVFDQPPSVLRDLLNHEDAAGATAVLGCCDLAPDQYPRLSALLTQIALASRPRAPADRPRVVVIGERHMLPRLPSGDTDVTFDAVWWWGRLTRWDVASRLATALEAKPGDSVLREVRMETILEVCRWDLDLADELAAHWGGDPDTLIRTIKDVAKAPSPANGLRDRRDEPSRVRPAEDLTQLWDAGQVDLWQHEHSASPSAALDTPGAIDHAVWVAQSRVLLPWIEVRRQWLVRRLNERYGEEAVHQAASRLLNPSGRLPLEVGPLYAVIQSLVPQPEPAMRHAARQLMNARNRLAHLQSLALADQRHLLNACSVLRGP